MSTVTASIAKRSFYEKTILGLFTNMKKGYLHITLASGEKLTLGEGNGVEAHLEVKDPYFFKRCVLYGDIGFGEAYMANEWDTPNITNVIKWFILNIDNAPTVSGSSVKNVILNTLKFFNRFSHLKQSNSVKGSRKNIQAHYDLNNAFFELFLDSSMTYSAAYFESQNVSLEQAQQAKYKRLCEQLNLKPEDHVLEIGSGWGGNAIYMAKHYGCKVTSVTISEEQHKLANERIKAENLQDKVEVIIQDYRKINGQFDKIVSIEMLEAVGAEYLETYFQKCTSLLKKQGILALQVITCPDSRFENLKSGVDWIQKHIFPGSLLPSVGAINKAVNHVGDLTLVDLKDIGLHYAHTLKTWYDNFNQHLPEVKDLGFDETFIRKWNYYLCYCEAAFAMRNINVMQMVYTRPNNTGR
jgi:cyclopropane-fatty-acyl-phospholipid synthase